MFYWQPLGKQVRVEGLVTRATQAESEAYFQARPRGSQVSAWASAQSSPVKSRKELEARAREIEARFAGHDVLPCPEFWGGFRLEPHCFEFWQEGAFRLHDRARYVRRDDGSWAMTRLSP